MIMYPSKKSPLPVQGVSQFLKFRICNHLVSNVNQKFQEEPLSIFSRCSALSWRHCWIQHVKLLIIHACSSLVIRLLSEIQMVRNPLPYDLHKCHEPLSSWPTIKSDSYLEMSWNRTSLSILLEQSWKIKFCNVFTQKISCIIQSIISLYLVKYIKMLTIYQQ